MKKLSASLLIALPLLAAAQQGAQPPAPPQAAPQYPPAYVPPAQYPPAYTPPPQYTPPAPQGQYAPPPAAQYAQQQYAPPPQYAPRAPAPPPQAQPLRRPGHQRDSWYIGFGLGGAGGSLERAGARASFKEYLFDLDPMTLSMNLKVGATVSPQLLIGLDISAVRSQVEEGGATAALQISNYDAVATFFPMGTGFFFRAGAGLSRFTYEEEFGGLSFSTDTTGFNTIGGLGYAFWLGRQFNLTLNLDVSYASYGTQDEPDFILPESTRYASFWVGCDWY